MYLDLEGFTERRLEENQEVTISRSDWRGEGSSWGEKV